MAFIAPIPVRSHHSRHSLPTDPRRRPATHHPQSRPTTRRPRHTLTPCMSSVQTRILWADTVSKTYDGETQILPPTSLSVPRGAKLAILGPNGSGKSTLLSILAGLSTPDRGTVTRMRGVTVAHVAQELPTSVSPDLPAFRAVLSLAAQHSSTAAVRAALRYADAAHAAEAGEEEKLGKLADAVSPMDGASMYFSQMTKCSTDASKQTSPE